MISCKFDGRLGNNMFQMAVAVAVAADNGLTCGFDKKMLAAYKAEGFFSGIDVWDKEPVWKFEYTEPRFRFSPVLNVMDGMLLKGWFQTEKYFEHRRQLILDLFGFKKGAIDAVSVHVRRGDYLKLPEHFPFVGIDYLQRAIAEFPHDNFIFFSDDIAWCKQNFKSDRFAFVSDTPLKDMQVMSMCKHHIISNSTFSWWAAWLNHKADKKVIAPKVWFGPKNGHLDTTDIIPEGWLKL